jgi:hypothetical protein
MAVILAMQEQMPVLAKVIPDTLLEYHQSSRAGHLEHPGATAFGDDNTGSTHGLFPFYLLKNANQDESSRIDLYQARFLLK